MKNLALLSDGRVIDEDEEEKVLDELKKAGIEIVKRRTVKSHKVQMYKMNGAEIFEGPMDWAGKFIPLVPEFGKVSTVEDREYIRGLVRKAKDSQRIYNYETSTKVEVGALSPLDPYFYTPRQADGHTDEYENFRTSNSPFMPYNPDPDEPGPPKRGGAPSVQAAMMDSIRQAENDLFMVTGMGPPSVGMNPGLQSGVALKRQDEKGDRGSFVFPDNHAKSIQYTGDILLDLIPRIYDTERVVRILHIDGESETVTINQKSLDEFNQPIIDEQTGEKVIVNDIAKGKYEASVVTGPAHSTQMEESADQLIRLSEASPRFEAIATDLIAKNLPILESDELTKRIRRVMINEGTVDPTDEEVIEFDLLNQAEPPPDPQIELIKMQQAAEAAKIKLENDKLDLEEDKAEADLNDKAANRELKARELALKEREAEIKSRDRELSIREAEIKASADVEKTRIMAQADIETARITADSQDKMTLTREKELDIESGRPQEKEEKQLNITVSPPNVDVNVDSNGNKRITVERQPDGSLVGKTENIEG